MHVARHGVDLDVDGVAHVAFFEGGVLNGVGNDVDADLDTAWGVDHLVDGEAHPIQGDGALVGEVTSELQWGQDLQGPTLPGGLKLHDAGGGVHVAGDQMPAQAVHGAQGFLQIDPSLLSQAVGFGQRFGRDLDVEMAGFFIQSCDGHARTIQGDAVAQTDIVQVATWGLQGEAFAVRGVGAQILNVDDVAKASDDSSKHGGYFRSEHVVNGSQGRLYCALLRLLSGVVGR